jgi:hypothetical protein
LFGLSYLSDYCSISPPIIENGYTTVKEAQKGGRVVKTKPYDMQLLDVEPLIKDVFQRVGCLNLCQNMQKGHLEVAREFALNFDGTKTKVVTLELEVSEATIAAH